jgi:2-polyprenyl-3-methyl-5-hydroxy-6-metoxy-1,4-benzoquinol methylase
MTDERYKPVRNALGFVSAEPLPSAAELQEFYREVFYQQRPSSTYQASYTNEERDHHDLVSAQILHAVAEARRVPANGARLMEIGCGEGFFLEAAAHAGYQVTGVDFSDFGLKSFHPHLLDRFESGDAHDFLSRTINSGGRTDVCVMQNVLEHVIDPARLLRDIGWVLSATGVAIIKVPNDYSRLQERARELGLIDRDFWFAPPQHLHYFTAEPLKSLVTEAGLEVVDLFSDFPIDIFLFHPGSNYVADPRQGKSAHNARVTLNLLLAERGIERYHALCRAFAACGLGRNITVAVRSASGRA